MRTIIQIFAKKNTHTKNVIPRTVEEEHYITTAKFIIPYHY